MTRLEKAMQMETKTLEERIVEKKCPHDYGMTDCATSSDFMCDGDCKACWDEEVEGDSNAGTET